MTENQFIESMRKAIEEYAKLPVEVQLRHLIEMGTINERGEVLMGLGEDEASAEASEPGHANGTPGGTKAGRSSPAA